MAMKKLFGFLLLISLLFASQENMIEVEGAICAKPSKYYHGSCQSDRDCARICALEVWPMGKCVMKGTIIRSLACECRRNC